MKKMMLITIVVAGLLVLGACNNAGSKNMNKDTMPNQKDSMSNNMKKDEMKDNMKKDKMMENGMKDDMKKNDM